MAKPTPGNHFSLIFGNIIFGWAQHSLTHYRCYGILFIPNWVFIANEVEKEQ
jgi:hypothetical protein